MTGSFSFHQWCANDDSHYSVRVTAHGVEPSSMTIRNPGECPECGGMLESSLQSDDGGRQLVADD